MWSKVNGKKLFLMKTLSMGTSAVNKSECDIPLEDLDSTMCRTGYFESKRRGYDFSQKVKAKSLSLMKTMSRGTTLRTLSLVLQRCSFPIPIPSKCSREGYVCFICVDSQSEFWTLWYTMTLDLLFIRDKLLRSCSGVQQVTTHSRSFQKLFGWCSSPQHRIPSQFYSFRKLYIRDKLLSGSSSGTNFDRFF
jgi:hypothetical protein